MNTRIGLSVVMVLMMGQSVYAGFPFTDDSKSPLGCRDQGYQFKLNTLTIIPPAEGDRQSLYFVYNKLNTPINLHQMVKDDSTRDIYLNHTIRAQQWSVLSTSENELRYLCAVDDAAMPHGKIVKCSDSVKVCEYARVKYGLNNKGNYWFSNSSSRGTAVNDVLHYGIIPK